MNTISASNSTKQVTKDKHSFTPSPIIPSMPALRLVDDEGDIVLENTQIRDEGIYDSDPYNSSDVDRHSVPVQHLLHRHKVVEFTDNTIANAHPVSPAPATIGEQSIARSPLGVMNDDVLTQSSNPHSPSPLLHPQLSTLTQHTTTTTNSIKVNLSINNTQNSTASPQVTNSGEKSKVTAGGNTTRGDPTPQKNPSTNVGSFRLHFDIVEPPKGSGGYAKCRTTELTSSNVQQLTKQSSSNYNNSGKGSSGGGGGGTQERMWRWLEDAGPPYDVQPSVGVTSHVMTTNPDFNTSNRSKSLQYPSYNGNKAVPTRHRSGDDGDGKQGGLSKILSYFNCCFSSSSTR